MKFRLVRKQTVFILATLVILPAALGGAENSPSTDKIGKKIERVSLKDAEGKSFAVTDLKDKHAVVAVFISFDCPVSTSYAQVLADLHKTYQSKGVAFIGITTNDDEDAVKHAAEYKIPFPVYKDEGKTAALAFQAEITPEAFVLDRHFILRYRGRIDNGYAARLKKNYKVTRHDLQQALDEVLANKPVSEPATLAIGCPIPRDVPGKKTSGKVTFYRDVLPILQNNCQSCHRPGEVGPFSLMTYRQAVNWAGDIKEYTQTRKMPPWKPTEGPAFLNERKMADKDIATLAAWVDEGTPEGNSQEAPPPRKFVQGWQMGKPDMVLTPGADFQVGPSGNDIFRCFVLPTNLPEDKYVTAVEVRPSNPRVVHHALLFIDASGQGRKLEQKDQEKGNNPDSLDAGPGYSSAMGVGFLPQGGLGGWAPGQLGRHLPEGSGYFLPKGSDVVMQVHYHRDGRLEKDRTQVGLYFAAKPVSKPFQGLVIGGGGRLRFFIIPAGASHHRIHGSLWVEQDFLLHSVMPHMHLIGTEIKVTMTPPNGPPQTLVYIPDWNYNWQESYFFKEPIPVKTGTRFEIEAYYNNSASNPNNPNSPPKRVTFGEQTTNEMCFGFLGATADKPGRIKVRFEEKPKEGS
ncbi:MAG TPA: redoxin domain-containing protein [Gemmataceae bacterium]|nr:redoxin domain-containing protein [Gemmataceae bacterium]